MELSDCLGSLVAFLVHSVTVVDGQENSDEVIWHKANVSQTDVMGDFVLSYLCSFISFLKQGQRALQFRLQTKIAKEFTIAARQTKLAQMDWNVVHLLEMMAALFVVLNHENSVSEDPTWIVRGTRIVRGTVCRYNC